jgi:hypothetical protein
MMHHRQWTNVKIYAIFIVEIATESSAYERRNVMCVLVGTIRQVFVFQKIVCVDGPTESIPPAVLGVGQVLTVEHEHRRVALVIISTGQVDFTAQRKPATLNRISRFSAT